MRGKCNVLILLLFNGIVLLTFGCQSSEQKVKADLKTQLTPILTIKKVVYDLGEIGPEQKKTIEVQFTNSGNGPLIIKQPNGCCGISVPKIRKKKYAPGQNGILKVEYTSGKYLGTETKQMHVSSNDKSKPEIPLTIQAKIVTKVEWEPKSIKLLLEGENTTCPQITISTLDNRPFSITDFKSTLNCITANVNPKATAAKFVLEPRIDAEKIQENMKGFIHISLKHPEWKTVTIPFNVSPIFTIEPSQIIIFNAEPKKPLQKSVRIASSLGKEFDVEAVSSQNNFIKVLSQKKGETDYLLDLEITPPDTTNTEQVFTDTLFIKIKSGPKIEIPCNGFYLVKE